MRQPNAAELADTIATMMASMNSWSGGTFEFQGTAPSAHDIRDSLKNKTTIQLTACKASTHLVKGGACKGHGNYIAVAPKTSISIRSSETLETLVPGLRIFLFTGGDDRFKVHEQIVASPGEVQESRERTAALKATRDKAAELKQRLHAHFGDLYSALAALSGHGRSDTWCNGHCDSYTKRCPYSMEKLLGLCDKHSISITAVMMEVVTRAE